jgi:tetratricopeptide (TPR) repeat protein
MSYGKHPEDEYQGVRSSIDDWDAEDWENFWTEPEESSDRPEEEMQADAWEDLDDDIQLSSGHEAIRVRPAPARSSPQLSPIEEARQLERQFHEAPTGWRAAKTVAALRKAKEPERAIRFVMRAHARLEGRASRIERAAMLTTVGASYADLGRYQIALACAKRAIQLAPEDSHPRFVAGKAAAKLGEHGRADAYFGEARRLRSLAETGTA